MYDSGGRNQHTFGKKFNPKHAPVSQAPVHALHPIQVTNDSNDDLTKVNLNNLNSPIELSEKKKTYDSNGPAQRESRRDSAMN